VSGLRALIRSVPVTTAYVGSVAALAALMELLGPVRAQQLARAASTNLVQLRRAPVRVLPASAFLLEERRHIAALPGLALSMGAMERWKGGPAAAATFAAGHVGATLVVAVAVAGGMSRGIVDPVHGEAVDVGISYGAWALWGALTPRLHPRWRPVHVAGSTGLLVTTLATRRSFTDFGHLIAWAIGLGIGAGLVSADAAGPAVLPGPSATRSPAR
jgi:hypothetical protein